MIPPTPAEFEEVRAEAETELRAVLKAAAPEERAGILKATRELLEAVGAICDKLESEQPLTPEQCTLAERLGLRRGG